MSPILSRLALPALAATLASATPCLAQDLSPEIVRLGGYATSYGQAGYGNGLVDGSYVGAPFTHVPSPRQIVPTPWGYGTYGVPTVSGIRTAPAGEPVVYVIDGAGAQRRATRAPGRAGDGRWSGMASGPDLGSGGGARVIQVRVPRR